MPFIKLKDVEEKEIIPGYRARMIHSKHMTSAYWTIEAGKSLPNHSHPHEQLSTILEGEFKLTLDGEERVVKPGDMAVIPGGVFHSGTAVTDCKILDVFYPIREDYQ